jgi:hypothetical protein
MKQPPVKEQIKSLAEAVKDSAKSFRIFASEQERERRRSICLSCEHCTTEMPSRLGIKDNKQRCEKCGCRITSKIHIYVAGCADKENPRWLPEGSAVSFIDDDTAKCWNEKCVDGVFAWDEKAKLWHCNKCGLSSKTPYRVEV